MTNDEKAKKYDRLLMEHDEKARQVSLIQSKAIACKYDTIFC